MGGLLDNLGQLVLAYQAWSRYLIALGIVIQGEVTVLVSMYLVINGSLGFFDFFVPALAGILISDYFLYFFGKLMRGTRFGWRIYKKLKQNKTAQFYTYYISQNLKKIIVISKFLIGTNLLMVLAAGWTKVKFGKFARSQILATLFWLVGVTAVSYFLVGGVYFLKVEKIFKQVEIGIAAILLVLIGGEIFLKKILGKALTFEPRAKEIGEKLNAELENEMERYFHHEQTSKVKSENAEDIFKKDGNGNA